MKIKGNILVLTHWGYKDALIQTYTMPYVEIMRQIIPPEYCIHVVTSEKGLIALRQEEIDAVNRKWEARNMRLIAQPYTRFGLRKLFKSVSQGYALVKLIKKEKISAIHAFCTPAGGIGYLLSKFTGVPLVIDSYEPHAETMIETGTWKRSGIAYKLLFWLEKRITREAAHIIATTYGMKDYANKTYGVELNGFFVKPACIDFSEFYPRPKDAVLMNELKLNGKIVCVYAGKLGGTYLTEEVFDFVESGYKYWGDDFRFLMLTSERDEQIQNQLKRVNVPSHILVKEFVSHQDVPKYLSLADFGINLQVPVPSKRYGAPIKNGEYWAMGLPVIISPDISDDSDIIEENRIGVVINLQKKENLDFAVRKMDELLKSVDKDKLTEKIFLVAKKYRTFDIARKIYPEIYSGKA